MLWKFALASLLLRHTSSSQARAEQKPVTLQHNKPPNIVFILTDDQDVHLSSLDYMPFVRKHILEQGTYFNKHYCTTAVCCPSRATLWSGKASHNTNITDVNPPYGGYPKWVVNGFNENYLPVWLQEAGYNTYYTGKFFNVHTVENYDSPFAAGWTGNEFLLDPYTYNYMNSTFQKDKQPPVSHEGEYVTDVMAEKAYGLLDDAVHAANKRPFFLTVAPTAPHGNIQMNGSALDPDHTLEHTAPIPAERHRHLFKDVKVPRTANFNPNHPSGANWLLDLSLQNRANIEYNDHFHRQRLRSLQAVDELVDSLIYRLAAYDILDNTYIVYSSDNGFHIGQHRLQPGKSCGYEEDINIPLAIRGPGVAANYTTDIVTTHTDLAPTFLQMLGIPLRDDLDGRPIPITEPEIGEEQRTRREHAGVEYWGFAGGEGIYDKSLHENNTYKAIRLFGPGYNLYYSIWCTNEHELYDMNADPGQLHNLLSPSSLTSTPPSINGHPIDKVVSRLDALLLILKSCAGASCREPWKELHPNGNVWTLADALSVKYDRFYEEMVKVEYDFCDNGYLIEAEGAMWETHGKMFWREGLRWDVWT
ncbi:arylsulfatase [Lophiotrema nucula]|uniref:Arylsulfatase n=1 Tax=Lophiotrema nucula TaxID=690887 RepID=A0A6A5Z4Q6_9PLEO|nr:arylsulfatase [Lophiotrema nucula]